MQFGCQSITYDDIKVIPTLLFSILLPISFSSRIYNEEDDGKCELVGTFSLITQAFLGLICISSLIIKRFHEYPLRRTWPVWLFDVLKQLIGAMGVHVFNLLLSILKTRKSLDNDLILTDPDDDGSNDDPCDWYFLNIVFDCTIGVYILYLVFKTINKVCKDWLHFTQIESGQYGPDPNKPSFKAFLKQLLVYFSSLMITKFILYGIVECFETQLLWVTSHILLVWLDEYPDEFEIFIVMFVVPIVMNCLQLILIDSFIQNQVLLKVNSRLHHQNDGGIDEDESEIAGEIEELIGQNSHKANPNDNNNQTSLTKENNKTYGTFSQV